MKTFEKNGRKFRLSGSWITDDIYFVSVYWFDTKEFEKFYFDDIEPFLIDVLDKPIQVVEVVKKVALEKPKRKPVIKPIQDSLF